MFALGAFDHALPGRAAEGTTPRRAEPEVEWADDADPSQEGDTGDQDESSSETSEVDATMKDRIKELRRQLKQAEDDAAERKSKKEKKRRGGKIVEALKDKTRGDHKVRDKDRDRGRKAKPPRPVDEAAQLVEKVEKKKKKKRQKRSSSEARPQGSRGEDGKKRTDCPPISRVRASDTEWEAIVRAGVERGMMARVPVDQLLRDHHGVPILNGAGGVRKVKTIGGESKIFQRFISILVPSNSYQMHMTGDDCHLPYLGQMGMMEIDEDEEILVDSEDLTSCFNLFRLPEQWLGYCAFSKTVSATVFGGPATERAYVGMRVVPMGWINSVALMQTVVRSLVFGLSGIPESSEVSKLKWFPDDDSVSVVYLDSYDELRKVSVGCRDVLAGGPSHRHQRFVNTCQELQLPLNEGKRLVGAVHGTLQGGDIDGIAGTFEASHDKKVDIMGLGAALLGAGDASEFELRHFVGKAIFAMAFRRPSMAFLERIFVDMGKAQKGRTALSRHTMDEIYMVMVLMPVLVMNLRAQLDCEVAITDASPTGGGGAVSRRFKRMPDTIVHEDGRCLACQRDLERDRIYPCPTGCCAMLCSLGCIERHRDEGCRRRHYMPPKFGEGFSAPNAPLSHAVARVGGIEVQPPYDLLRGDDFETPEGKQKLANLESDPALAAEHWAPECKLFSQARGKPVTLPDGTRDPRATTGERRQACHGVPLGLATDEDPAEEVQRHGAERAQAGSRDLWAAPLCYGGAPVQQLVVVLFHRG